MKKEEKDLKKRFESVCNEAVNIIYPLFRNRAILGDSIVESMDYNAIEILENKHRQLLKERYDRVSPIDKLKVDIDLISNPSRAELRDLLKRLVDLL